MEYMVTEYEYRRLQLSLNASGLKSLVRRQVNNIVPEEKTVAIEDQDVRGSLDRLEYCISRIRRKYYYADGKYLFNHLNGDQYSMFLYILSNVLYKAGKEKEAAKVFLLNKQMFGIDAFYAIELPSVFYFCHPLGTVLGNAIYSDYLVVYQGVTVGSRLGPDGSGGEYPSFGEGCALYANATVIGDSKIGNNVTFGAGALVIDKDIESNTVVLGTHPENRFIRNANDNRRYFFDAASNS